MQLCKWSGVRESPTSDPYLLRYYGESSVMPQHSQAAGGPRELLSHLHECQRRLNQVQSIILDMPPSTNTSNSSSNHLTLPDINDEEWKAVYAISLLPPFDEVKEAISFYVRVGLRMICRRETATIDICSLTLFFPLLFAVLYHRYILLCYPRDVLY